FLLRPLSGTILPNRGSRSSPPDVRSRQVVPGSAISRAGSRRTRCPMSRRGRRSSAPSRRSQAEEVIRSVKAEGGERADSQQDRHIGKRRAKDPEREDGGQAREEERDERDDRVEEAEGLRED